MSRDRLALKRYAVLAYNGKPIMVTRVGDDGSEREGRANDDTTLHYAEVAADGSLDRAGYIHGYRVEGLLKSGELRLIDHADVAIHVTLPADWQERNKELAKMAEEARAAKDYDDESVEHPSYGTITLSRTSGHHQLFMSPFAHQHAVAIRIHRAVRRRSLSNDRVHGEGPSVCEVQMSEAQFARFITSTSIGEGTPCTLAYVGGQAMPEAPMERETERFHEDVERDLQKAAKGITGAVEKVKEILAKPSVTKKDREEILGLLRELTRTFDDRLPFVVRQMDERMEHIVSAGKHEIESFFMQTVQQLGLGAAAAGAAPAGFLGDGGKKG